MPEERICPVCGRANALAVRACDSCGAAFRGAALLLRDRPGGAPPSATRRSWEADTQEEAAAASTWSSLPPPQVIPIPPQIKAEAERVAEQEAQQVAAKRRDEERIAVERALENVRLAAELKESARDAARVHSNEVIARRAASVTATCVACDKATDARFSFCLHCGADRTETSTRSGASPTMAERVAAVQSATNQGGGAQAELQVEALDGVMGEQAAANTALAQAAKTEGEVGVAGWAPFFASFFVPGVGQFLNGQAAKGIVIALCLYVAAINFGFSAWGLPLLLIRLLTAFDAYRIAKRKRKGERIHNWEWDLT